MHEDQQVADCFDRCRRASPDTAAPRWLMQQPARRRSSRLCSECHETADFEGEPVADVTATVKKIVAGQMKHKKALKLTDQQAADVAAFMAGGGK